MGFPGETLKVTLSHMEKETHFHPTCISERFLVVSVLELTLYGVFYDLVHSKMKPGCTKLVSTT